MFQHILVPLDGSPLAEKALPVAAQVARAFGGTLILVHVVDVSQAYVSYGALQPIISQDAVERSLKSGKSYLDGLLFRSELVGVAFEEQVVLGSPAVVILSLLDEQPIDLVIMSSHGYTGVKHWILGSIAEKVIHHTPVPTLILHEGLPPGSHPRPDGTPFVRALIPLDISARSQDAIAPAAALVAALSSPGQGELHLTQIITLPLEIDEREKETLFQNVRQNLQAISESTRQGLVANLGSGFRLTLTWSITLDSNIAAGIVKIAEHGDVAAEGSPVGPSDLIAMTTHGYTGIRKWTMGSVAERVLHTTKLPLLLTRPADMITKEHEEKKGPVATAV
jgi:nucleotide-binding universal stress UspA family protein